jgi:capsular exopolysaccharide synthesis family protein
MSKNDIEPTGGQPIWPLAPHGGGALALPQEWAPQPAASNGEIDLGTLWRIVSEWRWLILGCVAVGLAGAIVATFLTTPLYRATASLELNPPTVEILDASKGGRMTMGGDERAFIATQYALLGSQSLAQRVVQDLNLANNKDFVPQSIERNRRVKIAAAIVQGNFSVKPVEGSRVAKISYSSPSPTLAAQILNSYADNFINSNLERRYQASAYARQFLERQIAKTKGELERSERQLVAYAKSQGIINLGGATSAGQGTASDASSLQGQTLQQVNSALAAATARRIQAEQAYRNQAHVQTSDVTAGTATLRGQVADLESQYQEKLHTFRPEYPDMVRLRARIEALNTQITREQGTVSGSRAATLLSEYRAAAASERALQAKVGQLTGQVLAQRDNSIQYNIFQRDVDTNRSLYDALLQRYKEIGVAGGVGTNTVSVVDRADPPGSAYKPNLMLNLLIGLGLGLAAGLGAAIALEFLNDTIKTPEDVREKLGLPSLGIIPRKKGSEPLADELKDQSSPISEAYFSLRTSLQFTTETGAPKTLLITSTRAAEGKSSTTLALAQNFARLGNQVLLIDGDLRKPAFVTGSDPDEGLSKLLTNTEPLAKHVLKTQFENLSLLPCGPLPPNPAELLASSRLKTIMAEALNQYDMVIVDGPPVLGLADAPLLAGVCRATLLVVESGKTRTRAATDAMTRLKAAGGNIVGAVLTKFHQRAHGYGYGYGYGYEPYRYGGVGGRDREIKLIAQREA